MTGVLHIHLHNWGFGPILLSLLDEKSSVRISDVCEFEIRLATRCGLVFSQQAIISFEESSVLAFDVCDGGYMVTSHGLQGIHLLESIYIKRRYKCWYSML